jgi:3-oxoacyl-[acyl-carrier-protein] synthase-3
MRYNRVYLESLGYELPPVVVSSAELENRLAPVYDRLRIAPGQLEALTGIAERRWWEAGFSVSGGAASAAKKALDRSGVRPQDVEVLIYAGVCRENFEPATACAVASAVGVSPDAQVYDISNACLGVLNDRIELGQIRAGLVVSCESAREINDIVIHQMLADPTMEMFTRSLATLTGGSGAAAVLLTDGSFGKATSHRLLGAVTKAAPEHHGLCRWGITWSPIELGKLLFSPERLMALIEHVMAPETIPSALKKLMTHERIPSAVANLMPSEKLPAALTQVMATDSVAVLKHGVELGVRTWGAFLGKLGWGRDQIDKVICHQVGAGHRDTILKELGIPKEKDFSTYEYLGNMGTVSLPLTAALADHRHFLKERDRVVFLGLGCGLICLLLGWGW